MAGRSNPASIRAARRAGSPERKSPAATSDPDRMKLKKATAKTRLATVTMERKNRTRMLLRLISRDMRNGRTTCRAIRAFLAAAGDPGREGPAGEGPGAEGPEAAFLAPFACGMRQNPFPAPAPAPPLSPAGEEGFPAYLTESTPLAKAQDRGRHGPGGRAYFLGRRLGISMPYFWIL